MRRTLRFALAALAVGVIANSSPAAEPGELVRTLSSRFEVTGTNDKDYVVDVLVWWTDGASSRAPVLSVTIGDACRRERCRGTTFVKEVAPEALAYDQGQSQVSLKTRFAGKRFQLTWLVGDPEPEAGDTIGYARYAVTANNALNTACFGEGEETASAPTGTVEPPTGKPEPDKVPTFLRRDPQAAPSCTHHSPHD